MKKDLSCNSNASSECIEAAKKLIDRYRSITVDEVKNIWTGHNTGELVARRLTGFGRKNQCSLCQSVKKKCSLCIYFGSIGGFCYCNGGVHN